MTLRDKSEKVLAEFIIGNEVKDRPGHAVRPRAVVEADLRRQRQGRRSRRKFADWIETNLLKLDASHIRSVTFDNHKVDPEQRRIVPGEKTTISRIDGLALGSRTSSFLRVRK